MTQAAAVLTGPIGSAFPLDPARNTHPETSLASWYLDLPRVHPFWPRYILGVVHLRPIAGQRPPSLHYPRATHELLVVALNPDRPSLPGDPTTWNYLLPPNVVFQFDGLTDAGAVSLGEFAAREVIEGRLWVETADRRGERERWKSVLAEERRRLAERGMQ